MSFMNVLNKHDPKHQAGTPDESTSNESDFYLGQFVRIASLTLNTHGIISEVGCKKSVYGITAIVA